MIEKSAVFTDIIYVVYFQSSVMTVSACPPAAHYIVNVLYLSEWRFFCHLSANRLKVAFYLYAEELNVLFNELIKHLD